jgi:hypothetical protein
LSDKERDMSDKERWLIGGSSYMIAHPPSLLQHSGASQDVITSEPEVALAQAIDFRCDIPFTEIPRLAATGFEAQKELKYCDAQIAAHYKVAEDCLKKSLGDPLCDVLLMIVLTFASCTVTPVLPKYKHHCEEGPRKDHRLLAATLATRMVWFYVRMTFHSAIRAPFSGSQR